MSASRQWPKRIAIATSFLFVLDLFLDWQKAAVQVGNVVSVESTASGWKGFGIAAGVFMVLVLLFAFNDMPLGAFACAVFAFAATVLSLFTVDATVPAPARVSVVESTLWPAWVGAALAAAATVATALPALGAYARTPSRDASQGTG